MTVQPANPKGIQVAVEIAARRSSLRNYAANGSNSGANALTIKYEPRASHPLTITAYASNAEPSSTLHATINP